MLVNSLPASDRGAPSIHTLFLMTIGALALLALGMSGLIVFRLVASLQDNAERELQTASRDISYLVDREIAGVTNTLSALAAPDGDGSPDVEKMYNRSVEVSKQIFPDFFVVLYHLSRDEHFFNTRFPFSAPLPQDIPFPPGEAARAALLGGKPAMSDVFFGPRVRQHVVIDCVPVPEAGGVRFALCGNFSLDVFAETLRRSLRDERWIVTLSDRKGIIVARSQDHDKFSGKPAASLGQVEPGASSGKARGPNSDGVPFVWAYQRMESTGWLVGVGVPRGVLDAPMLFGIGSLLVIAVVVAFGAAVIAKRASGPFERSMKELRDAVSTVQREPGPAPPAVPSASHRKISSILAAASAELLAREEHRRFVLAAAEVGTWQWDLDTGREIWSDRYREIIGASGEVLSCLESFLAQVHPSDRPSVADAVMRHISHGEEYDREYRILRHDTGEERWVHAKSRVERDPSGRPLRVLGVGMDITAYKRAEQGTHDGAARLRAIVDTIADGVILIDARGHILLFNPACETLFGYGADEVIGRNIKMLMPPSDRDEHDRFLADYRPTGIPRIVGARREVSGQRKDGTQFPLTLSVGEVKREGESLFVGLIRDLTERKQNQRERDELRRRLMRAHDDERLRLARELHDETGQLLVAAMLDLKRLEPVTNPQGLGLLRRLRSQLDEMDASLNRVARELRPSAIDDLGVARGLAEHIAGWSERFGIAVDYHCLNVDLDALPADVGTVVFRICQEALTNIAKHARGATDVGITVDRSDRMLRLTIEDNGSGFDPAAGPAAPRNGGGLGIAGMRERLALIGGELLIESSLGVGTTIFVRIALETTEATRWATEPA
jgi:two-component system sensor kinase FixL